MALKRKLDADSDDVSPTHTKQLKLIPFPNVDLDSDVMMSESEALSLGVYHTRLQSTASSTSSNASDSPISGSPAYPAYDAYPLPAFGTDSPVNTDSHNFSYYSAQSPTSQIGLLQPSRSFIHHGANCTQIPKLRIACASNGHGQRTMWSHCEQCGAISMVESD